MRSDTPEPNHGKFLPPNPTLKANREWLTANRANYRGQWVALRNGELLAVGSMMQHVIDKTSHIPRVIDGTAQVLITRA